MKRSLFLVAAISGITASAMTLAVYLAYNNDMRAAKKRIAQGKLINTTHGQIHYADVGRGKPMLVVHGAGGGFDQGLFTARSLLGKDITDSYRIIAPSRFGYLKTPPPSNGDASPAAQADTHAALLDALGVRDRVIVMGVLAGALSGMQFAIKHPERVAVLILEVPDNWKPPTDTFQGEKLMANNFIMKKVVKSDFIMWAFTKVAKDQMLTFLGAPPELQKSMTLEEQQEAGELVNLIFPVSERQGGIINDGNNSENLQRFDPEDISAPTLIIDA